VSNQCAYSRGTRSCYNPIYRCRDGAGGRRDKFLTRVVLSREDANSRDSAAMHARGRIPKSIATASGTREKGSGRSIRLNSADPVLTSTNKCTNTVRAVETYEYRMSAYSCIYNSRGKARWRFLPTLGSHRRLVRLAFHRSEPSCRYHANGDFLRLIMQRIRMSGVTKPPNSERKRMNDARLKERFDSLCSRRGMNINHRTTL